MLSHYLPSLSTEVGRRRFYLTATLAIIFLNKIGVASAQEFYREVPQRNAIPVMQQNGEVIISYYYPVVEQQFYVPLPQQSVYQPPQIGFPTPQPRFLPSGPLYIELDPAPAPQSNIYGEVIIGEFEDSTPQVAKPETTQTEPKVVDKNSTPPPKTEDDDPDAPNALAKQRSGNGTDDDPKKTSQKESSTTQDKKVAAAENKIPASGEDTDPKDASAEPKVAENPSQSTQPQTPSTDSNNAQPDSGSTTQQLAGQTDTKSAMTSAGPRRSDSFMDPLGPIAEDQKTHLFWVTVLTMIAIVPVFVLLPLILFKYRRGRKRQDTYQPKWDSSSFLEILMWGVPVVLVTFMSARLWHSTHVLDPYAEISSKKPTVNVQVVGLDWKWLFIYPDHGIATVGEFNMPVEQPVSMTLTTDTVMQSFAIPALAGQIYAMPGMTTKLNLIADQLGSMEGENTQFNGDGFAEQKFITNVVSAEEFEAWVQKVKQNSVPLDQASYKILAQRTTQSKAIDDLATDGMPPRAVYFTLDDPQFFMNIMMRYMNHKPLKDEDQPGSPEYGVPVDTSLSTGDDQ